MFPLKERSVSGYRFGEKTYYSAHHLGTDYKADHTVLYAPFDGTVVEAFTGVQGGKTIWFKPDHDDIIMRFLHLDFFPVKKGERVRKGWEIGLTGNTGQLTKGPHLHLDISRDSFILAWPGHFIDPETYNWDWEAANQPQPDPTQEAFWITVNAPLGKANLREGTSLDEPIVVTYGNGARIECSEEVDGDPVTVTWQNGTTITSKRWYKSKKRGLFIAEVVAERN